MPIGRIPNYSSDARKRVIVWRLSAKLLGRLVAFDVRFEVIGSVLGRASRFLGDL